MKFKTRTNQKIVALILTAGTFVFGITYFMSSYFQQTSCGEIRSYDASALAAEYLLSEGFKSTMAELNNGQTAADDPKLVEAFRKAYLTPANNKPYNLTEKRRVNPAWSKLPFPHLGKLDAGFFIECGGFDGESFSNTLYLERMLGWEGLLVEADPTSYKELLSKNRKAWSSNTCISTTGYPMQARLFQNTKNPKVNGLTFRNYHELNNETTVQCFPLYTMLLALNRRVVDFFSLDVEGAELDILQTIPFDKIRIKFLLIEVVNIREPGDNPSQFRYDPRGAQRVTQFMNSKGFELIEKVPMGGGGDDLMFKYTGVFPITMT